MSDVAPVAPVVPVPAKPDAGSTLPASGTVPVAKKAAVKPTSPATPDGATQPKEEELFEVVEDGEKRQYTREQVVRELQKRGASGKQWREARELTKKNQELIAMLKDPARFEEAATKLGHNLDELSQRRLAKAVEHSQLSEEQKELLTERQKREGLEAELKRFKETEAKTKQEHEDRAAFEHFEKGFLAAADRHGVEGTPDNLQRIVEIASEFHELGIPATEDQVMAELKEREDSAFSKLEARVTKGLKGEALAKRLGPAVVEEVLRWSVERLRGGPPAAAKTPVQRETSKADPKNPGGYVTDSEFRKKHGF